MEILIDGIPYVPAGDPASSSPGRIGIAITTHNRPDVLAQALEHHAKHRPTGAHVVLVDDGSSPPASSNVQANVQVIRHPKARGIVAAKNACLAALLEAGCEHLFLFDDDAWPLVDDWHQPYIESAEPHLSYQFADLSGPRKLNDITCLHRDEGHPGHVAYSGQRGVMLYYHRSVIETVGGFDWSYGRGMFEHPDLAMRIHHAGLTTWAYADVAESSKLIYSLDEHDKAPRTIDVDEREKLNARNAELYGQRRDAKHTGYVSLRPPRDVVLTTLLTATRDPQRNKTWQPSASILDDWASSILKADPIVLADQLTEHPKASVEFVPISTTSGPTGGGPANPYFLRWTHIYRWLREHDEVRWVFATDGSDVTMLRPPWEHLTPGALYAGWEPTVVACPYMRSHYRGPAYDRLWDTHGSEPLHNCGILGGDRDTVLGFVHEIVAHFATQAARRFWRNDEALTEDADMGVFNLLTHSSTYAERVVTGPQVATVFKAGETAKTNSWSWWAHK